MLKLIIMRKQLILLALPFIIASLSCNKDDDEDSNRQVYRGFVSDVSNFARLQGVNVELHRADGMNPDGSFNNDVVTAMTTNNNGEFFFSVDPIPGKTIYKVVPVTLSYKLIMPTCSTVIAKPIVSSNNLYRDTLNLDKLSFVNVTLTNQAPASATDTMDFTIVHQRTCNTNPSSPIYQTTRKNFRYIGTSANQVRDTFSLKEYPLLRLKWIVRNGSIQNEDSLVIPVNEYGTTNFPVNY